MQAGVDDGEASEISEEELGEYQGSVPSHVLIVYRPFFRG